MGTYQLYAGKQLEGLRCVFGMGDRLGLEVLGGAGIDKCPDCKGIWLDQGELELLATDEARVAKRFLGGLFG